MKYVVLESVDGPLLFVFPASIDHDAVATLLCRFGKPVRAGFVRRTVLGLVCQGRSILLGLEADPEVDGKLLREQLEDRFYS